MSSASSEEERTGELKLGQEKLGKGKRAAKLIMISVHCPVIS
jgi:hypothetical protein